MKTDPQKYHELALSIALELDATWETGYQPGEGEGQKSEYAQRNHELKLQNGRTVMIRFDDPTGRLTAYGTLPAYLDRQRITTTRENPRITCNMERGPEAIARDIKARLLPGFYAAYTEAENRRAADIANVDAAREIAQLFIDQAEARPAHNATWKTPADIKQSHIELHISPREFGPLRVSGQYHYVSLEFKDYDLPAAKALEIVKAVRGILYPELYPAEQPKEAAPHDLSGNHTEASAAAALTIAHSR